MPFEPDNITRDDVIHAARKVRKEGISLEPSTKYDVIIEGNRFPPKEIMRYVHEMRTGEFRWDHSGGDPTNT